MAVSGRRLSTTASPGAAAWLSFFLPGLGQIAVGAVRRGVVLGLPIVVLVLAGIVLVSVDARDVVTALVRPNVVLGLVVADLFLAAYHLASISDAWHVARRAATDAAWPIRRRSGAFLVAALVVTIAVHGLVAAVGVQAYQTLSAVFTPPDQDWSVPSASFDPSSTPGSSPSPGAAITPSPDPVPAWARDGRLNVLLIGGDSGPGRWSIRTDSMVVLSIDIKSGHAAMFGVPRNLLNVPLPPESAGAFPGGRYPGLLNSLYVYAAGHPADFPGGDARGFRAVTGAIQQLVGQTLDGVIVVNLNGFVDLVNALGGVWVDVQQAVYDDHYPLEDGSGYITVSISDGCHHFNGRRALEYARSRHQDSDYGRMGRQQQVLVSLARQVSPFELLPQIPTLLGIAKDNLFTTIRSDDIPGLATVAASVDTAHVQQLLFAPPTYPEWLTTKTIKAIQKTFRTVFDGSTSNGVPSPTPSPTPRKTPTPCPAP